MTSPRTYPLRLGSTIAHLAVLGTIGWGVIGGLIGLLAAAFGLTFAFGVGLFLFAGSVYVLYGLAWVETERVAGLYGLPGSLPPFAPFPQPGFWGWVKSLGWQLRSAPMWRALANFFLACLIGIGLVPVVRLLVGAVVLLFAPLSPNSQVRLPFGYEVGQNIAPLYGVAGILLAAGAGLALALLHRTLATAVIGAGLREAQLSEQVQRSHAQHAGAVRAADVERTRIERDLHDGVQPRLVSVGMTLGLAQAKIDAEPQEAKELIAEAHTSTKAAITELRQLARGIHASVLDDRGLDAALSALVARSHIPVSLDVRMNGRVDREAETALYFVIAEALTNAAKHSRASECRVTVRVRQPDPAAPPVLWARVEDNGVGGARVLPGGGLDGVTNRVVGAGGTITMDSPAGGPTAVEVNVPCGS